LLAADGGPAGRADRRPGVRAGLLCLEAGARRRRDRLSGGRGLGRAVLGLPVVEAPAPDTALGRPAGAARLQAAGAVRLASAGARRGGLLGVAAPRRLRAARLLERRRHLHAGAERRPAVGAAPASLPGTHVLGGAGAGLSSFPREGVAAFDPALDELRRPDA